MTPKEQKCCEKCYDVYFEKDYPAHTALEGCTKGYTDCPCHQGKETPTPTESWEERFDEQFDVPFRVETGDGYFKLSELKDFIHQTLQAQKQTILNEIEEMKGATVEGNDTEDYKQGLLKGFNASLDELSERIKNL